MGKKNPIVSIHDIGAGGLSNAVPEIINDGGRGGVFELRNVPNDEPGMSPLEIWCNESQERYVLVVDSVNLSRFEKIAQRERAVYTVLGETTEQRDLILNDKEFSNTPIDIPLEVLLGKPPKMTRVVEKRAKIAKKLQLDDVTLDQACERVLQMPCVADKSFLITIGDRSITGMVHRDQMVGPWQVPVADAAITTVALRGNKGEAMAIGERTPIAIIDHKASTRMAVAESIMNLASADINQLSDIKLSANWQVAANHSNDNSILYEAVETIGEDLCPELGIAIPVGKDSMSMKTSWNDEQGVEKSVVAPLSLVITGFAPVEDVTKSLTPELYPSKNSKLLWIGLSGNNMRLGGSVLAQAYNQLGDETPNVNAETLKSFFKNFSSLKKASKILSYHDVSDGGVFVTLVEMAFAGSTGLEICLDEFSGDDLSILFNEELSAVIQVREDDISEITSCLENDGVLVKEIGELSDQKKVTFSRNGNVVFAKALVDLRALWSRMTYEMQACRDNPDLALQEYNTKLDADNPGLNCKLSFDITSLSADTNDDFRPKIAVLREQGVNGQLEMGAAFTEAGFVAIDVHMSDLLEKRTTLDSFAGIVACGGFSYGDVLGAGEGWAKTILLNPYLREMFENFFSRKDTFALGVCNGCQMLSNLWELIPGAEHWPKFVQNESERFEARTVLVEIGESNSIFLKDMNGSRIPIAVAHGEGKASFERCDIKESEQNISLRYVDNYGNTAVSYPANPNGSPDGVAGLSSADGRVMIMMPHPERVYRTVTNSWAPSDWGEFGPWLKMFKNAKTWLSSHLR